MKSIARKDFIVAGTVDKTHGTKGDLRISLSIDKPFKEWAFLEIQGKPVPFYIKSIQTTFDDGALLRLQDIDSIEKASVYVGYTLLALRGKRKKEVYAEDDFAGFKLIDEKLGEIGEVESLEEYPNQLLIKTHFKGEEVLIPAVEAFIQEINEAERTIYLQLPEGLLEI
jgi:16S rRNA processing protein RimM